MKGYQLHIALYHHRHGIDVNAYWVKRGIDFGEDEAIERLGEEWEGEGTEANRDDESMEVYAILDTDIHQVEL